MREAVPIVAVIEEPENARRTEEPWPGLGVKWATVAATKRLPWLITTPMHACDLLINGVYMSFVC